MVLKQMLALTKMLCTPIITLELQCTLCLFHGGCWRLACRGANRPGRSSFPIIFAKLSKVFFGRLA